MIYLEAVSLMGNKGFRDILWLKHTHTISSINVI